MNITGALWLVDRSQLFQSAKAYIVTDLARKNHIENLVSVHSE